MVLSVTSSKSGKCNGGINLFTISAGVEGNANERLRSMLALNAERRRSSNEPEISLDEINA